MGGSLLDKDRNVDARDMLVMVLALGGGLLAAATCFGLIIFGVLMLIQNRG